MRVWINGLSLAGLAPRIVAVATAPEARLDMEEKRQISRHIKQGHRLLNAPYYQQHVADLSTMQAAEPDQQDEAAPSWPPAMGVARMVFGRLARARAAGQLPAWAAALIVIASAPLYLLLLVLRALFDTKSGIYLLLLGGAGSVLWDAGFDAAVRDLLLSRLPLEEWSVLWAVYVAPPLANLASSFVQTVLLAAVVLAGVSYAEVAKSVPRKARQRPARNPLDIIAADLNASIAREPKS